MFELSMDIIYGRLLALDKNVVTDLAVLSILSIVINQYLILTCQNATLSVTPGCVTK